LWERGKKLAEGRNKVGNIEVIFMNKILLIHGANLNLLGRRNPEQYGNLTLKNIEDLVTKEVEKYGFSVLTYQSNHEGYLIDTLQKEATNCSGIIINPGAFSHYSYAIHDALLDTQLPVVEVHLSKISEREEWRRKSVITAACIKAIEGKKEKGYVEAVEILMEHLRNESN
jgi:3-dehydroquinate dehydratase-2